MVGFKSKRDNNVRKHSVKAEAYKPVDEKMNAIQEATVIDVDPLINTIETVNTIQTIAQNSKKKRETRSEKKAAETAKWDAQAKSNIESGFISRVMKKYDIPMSNEVYEDCIDYFATLVRGGFKGYANRDFTKRDGGIYECATNFFDAAFGTDAGEWSFLTAGGYMNENMRRIIGKPKRDERIGAKEIRKAYLNCESIKHGVGRFSTSENWTRNAAWIATHAYIMNGIMDMDSIIGLVPTTNDDRIIKAWNGYVDGFSDVPTSVKMAFTIGKGGDCDVRRLHNINTLVKEAGPTEDQTFDTNADVPNKDIVLEVKTVEEKAAELDAQCKMNIEIETAKEEKKESAEANKEYTFGELKEEVNEEPAIQGMSSPVFVNPQTGVQEQVSFDPFFMNNMEWHHVVPKLDQVTKLTNSIGMSIAYSPDPMFPGLVIGSIYIKGNPMIFNQIRIDPYLIYGDTLRVVTMDNKDNDIRKETFIPVSQQAILTKLLKKEFTKEDRQKISDGLPRCFSDFTEKYNILDRVDFRGIKGMPMKNYYRLIENVSNILKDKDCPMCRFRIVDVESADKFKLVCDPSVLSAFNTNLINEPSCIEALMTSTWIEFDLAGVRNKRGWKLHSTKKAAA